MDAGGLEERETHENVTGNEKEDGGTGEEDCKRGGEEDGEPEGVREAFVGGGDALVDAEGEGEGGAEEGGAENEAFAADGVAGVGF